MLKLDIISDPVCPWCYIGKTNLDRALEQHPDHPFTLEWHPFQLNPDMPKEGVERHAYLDAKFGGRDRVEEAEKRISAAAGAAGIEIDWINGVPRVPNTLDAHRLIHWAGIEGRQTPVVAALFRAYWKEGRDIGDARGAGRCRRPRPGWTPRWCANCWPASPMPRISPPGTAIPANAASTGCRPSSSPTSMSLPAPSRPHVGPGDRRHHGQLKAQARVRTAHLPAGYLLARAFPKRRWLLPLGATTLVAVLLHLVIDTIAGSILWLRPLDDRPFTLVTVPPTHVNWVISFLTHWAFLLELAIRAAALALSRRRPTAA